MKRKQVLDYINSKCFLKQQKQNIDDLQTIVNDIVSTPANDLQATQNNLNKLRLSVTDGAKNKE